MITLKREQYIKDSDGNTVAVLLDISAYEKMLEGLKNVGNAQSESGGESEMRTGTYHSASDIFGMLKHRKLEHPVSVDEMNAAIRNRVCNDDCS